MPLADTLRPTTLDSFIGQKHLVGEDKPIRQLIETGQPFSIIFWGPPGVGKTTLAKIIARETNSDFVELSAVSAGKADVRKVVEEARGNKQIAIKDQEGSQNTILFLDEIHRFNKAQQDFLLPYVEDGTIILIGATTENPSFSVISPLLSRCHVFVLEELTQDQLKDIIKSGIKQLSQSKGSNHQTLAIEDEAIEYLITFSNGDARKALNLLETTTNLYFSRPFEGVHPESAEREPEENVSKTDREKSKTKKITTITLKQLKNALQSKHIRYDKKGDEHYNTVSAFIKSMRASQPNAALYYLARMVEAGEDPLFIARRMVIFASEDVGMAQPTALVVANEVFRACQTIGYPECAINLAHGVVYLSKAKKDRSAYNGLRAAQKDVKTHGNLPIPKAILNAPTDLMKKQGYGSGYEKYPDKDKDYLPDELKGTKYIE